MCDEDPMVESTKLSCNPEIKDPIKTWTETPTEIPKMIKDKQFVEIQWPRLQKVLDIWMSIK